MPATRIPLVVATLLAVASGCATSQPTAVGTFQEDVTSDNVVALVSERGFSVTGHYYGTPDPQLLPLADLEIVTLATLQGSLHVYTFRSSESARENALVRDFGSTCRERPGALSIQSGRFPPTRICDKVPVFQKGSLVVTYIGTETLLEPVLRSAFGAPVQS